ncbi:hypothetical protein [Rhizobium sp. Root651]|uniref:hypothetical protein n=1 Tax=Rhizobium sp. Root651 TaxID=1736577 RepID=UPI00071294D3|nr:hypothetical protein [Rhizobium sp. Root651]KRA58220.1 hypothetical protein ASD85_17225 [Rhizobium sp. Root651]
MSELRRYEATLVHKCGKNPYMVMASADDGDYCEYQQAADEITRLRQLLYEAEKREKEVRAKVLNHAAVVAYATCAETRHVTLGDKVAASIRALQSEER